MKLFAGLVDLVYPRDLICLCCKSSLLRGESALCADCWEAFVDLPQPRGPAVEGLDGTMCALPHLGPARDLVHHLKYEAMRVAAEPLGRCMAEVVRGQWDALVPVPLHKRRQRQRGYNRAELLARDVAERLGLAVWTPLRRRRATAQQVSLGAEQRRENMKDAFACPEVLEGARLLLVDDVITTGSTALAAARALRDAGAVRVGLLTATRAMPGGDGL